MTKPTVVRNDLAIAPEIPVASQVSSTHTVDGIRYFCISRVMNAHPAEEKTIIDDETDENLRDYDEYMCGGEISESYM